MGEGVREAAQELFRSRLFVSSVALSVLVYFAAWMAPEPLFTKAFVAKLTLRLALLVGVVELSRLASACVRLYQEAEAARTVEELEAVAERFGRAVGGTGLRVDGYHWHHLATNKNDISERYGGPWTPRFEQLFELAGMRLDASVNLVYLKGNKGPHPEAYHEAVFEKLNRELRDCGSVSRCRDKLLQALGKLAEEVCTPGSRLHRLVTKPHD
jgi:hypothetical protein